MHSLKEYADQLASSFQENLRQEGDLRARVIHDWNQDVYYRFVVELQVEFNAQDIAVIGMNQERWISKFRQKLQAALTPKTKIL